MNRGGDPGSQAEEGANGTVTGVDCPPGLHGIFCEVNNLWSYRSLFEFTSDFMSPMPM